MKKLTAITLSLFVFFTTVNFAQNQSADQTNSGEIESEEIINADSSEEDSDESEDDTFVCDLPASVTDLELSQKEIILNCQATDKSCSNNKIVKIAIVAVEPDGEDIKYVYTITAGKIIGEGANVEWDLSGVKPGTYAITAAISQPSVFGEDGWAVFGMTQTRTVIVKECPDCK